MTDMNPKLPNTGQDEDAGHKALTLLMPPDLLAAMDAYTVDASGQPDRSAVLLRIVRDWLNTNGYIRSDPLGRIDDETA